MGNFFGTLWCHQTVTKTRGLTVTMATIFKRGDVYYVDYRQNGERVQRSLGLRVKRLAEIKRAEIELNIERGLVGLGKHVESSAKAFQDFEAEVLAKKSPPWRKRTEQLLRPFKTWVLARPDTMVTRLSASEIEQFMRSRWELVSAKTLNEELAIVKRLFRWLVDREFLAKDPTARIERLRQDPKEMRVFTPNELELIFKHATPTQLPYYRMLLFTGLRDGELRNLEWADIDFAHGALHVRIKADWLPKTRRGRVVPLASDAVELLNNLPRIGKYVFSTRHGKMWVPPRQPWVDLLARIETKEGVNLRGQVSIHTFRHTFATACLQSGIDIKTVSEFLGHTTVKMTEKYLHLLPEHKSEQMRKVDFKRLVAPN